MAQFFEVSQVWHAWNLLLFFLTVASFYLLLMVFQIRSLLSIILLACFCLIFQPSRTLFQLAQTPAFALFGVVLGLSFSREKAWLAVGLFSSMTLIKPHLFIPFYIYLAYEIVSSRNYALFFGMILGSLFLIAPALFFDPAILQHYFNGLSTQASHTSQFFTPTVSSWLYFLFGIDRQLSIIAIIVLGILATLFLISRKNRLTPTTLIVAWLLPLGLVIAPYVWLYDFVMLLPACFYLVSKFSKSLEGQNRVVGLCLLVLLVALNILSLLEPAEMQYSAWYPWSILAFAWIECTMEKFKFI